MLLCFSYLCAVLIVYTLVSASFIKVMLYLPLSGRILLWRRGGLACSVSAPGARGDLISRDIE